jgi:hypothetical protein
MTQEVIELGDRVVCDDCDEDFTTRKDKGGILFQSKAICPVCAPTWEENAREYGEESFIRGRCPDGIAFADWVRDDLRQGKPGRITIITS